ncbi:MAG: ATP-dependent helicase [Candidatus Thiodiazotropha taylori]|uniref:DNA 3'-5' helicase n=1 Tax=Candidatus Thiodiazotropha taylori TaxID=2792791 RepID=A0A9E4KCW5_9GAMM|nr:ATP-dependent helicase [Candidatus Thiodiazotropha taylori]MCW4256875.1 ATP-dependent helicase [Candidatus Thiodiazotropha taylori]
MTEPNPENSFDICEKRRAILEGDGHMLVVGGPGAGKTTIALLKARRHVLKSLTAEQSVLFLSFSNSAIRRILESAGGILTSDIAKRVDIKTYHSFAWDILKSHGYLTSQERRLRIVSAQDAAVRAAGLSKEAWLAEQERLYIDHGLVTYDQFAPRAAEILNRSDAATTCFNAAHPLILVDEFQDTDEDQWALIRALSVGSSIIALGDKEQRIYEWRDGVSEHRLSEFGDGLNAPEFDFQNENNRSPATGIAGFARSLLSPDVVQELPDDIERRVFQPGMFSLGLRLCVIRTWNETKKRKDDSEIKIAIAARSKQMVRKISDVLATPITIRNKEHKPIPHDVLFDQMQIVLAARVLANIMGSSQLSRDQRVSQCLRRISDMLRAANNVTNIKKSNTLQNWAQKCDEGKRPKTKCVEALVGVIDAIENDGFSGSPTQDWLMIRRAFEGAGVDHLTKTAESARFLRLLRRGSLIEEELTSLWRTGASYVGAEEALDRAILQDQLLDSSRESANISVMNMHQLKGREYDGVLLVEDQYQTFRGRDAEPPYMETRRLVQVSLTRAKHFALVLSATKNATLDVIFDN